VEFFSTVTRISFRVLIHIITLSNIVSDGIPLLPTKLVEKTDYRGPNDNVMSAMVINGQVEPIPQSHHCHHQLDIISWMEAYCKFLAVLVAAEATSQEELGCSHVSSN